MTGVQTCALPISFAKGGAPVKKVGPLFPFVEETAEFALSGANVSCTLDVPVDLWDCEFDKNQIGQVVDNLVINAQQAMPMGGDIRIGARNLTLEDNERAALPAGKYVELSIEDHGIGMPPTILDRIFDPFFSTKSKGHGLGLATCYSIVDRHGGAVEVESEQGKGTTFRIYLPAARGAGRKSSAITPKAHKAGGDGCCHGR